MPDVSQDIGALLLAVGELKGKVGEIAHGQNDMRQKIDGMAEKLFTAPTREDYDKLSARIGALESAKAHDDGAKGVLSRIIGSKAFGVVATAILSALTALVALKEGIVK